MKKNKEQEQGLQNNIREINDLKTQKRLLKEVLDDLKKLMNQKIKKIIN